MQVVRNVASPTDPRRCSRSLTLRHALARTLSPTHAGSAACFRNMMPLTNLQGREPAGGGNQKAVAGAFASISSPGLDFKPTLSAGEELLCSALAVVAASAISWACKRLSTSLPVIFTVLLFVVIWQFLRNELLEQQYKAAARSSTELGDDESLWRTVGGSAAGSKGLQVHVKLCAGRVLDTTAGLLGVHCYHGFGANLYSYARVQRMMADRLGGVVTSHDAPGFGLTERPKDVPSYFLTYNGRLGAEVLEAELQSVGMAREGAQPGDSKPLGNSSSTSSSNDKRFPEATKQSLPFRPPSPVSILDGLQGSCSSAMSLDVVLPDDQALTPGEEDAVVRVEAPPDTPPLSDPVAAPHVTPSTSWQPPVRAIRILLGHSLGGICASLAALEQAAHRTKGSTVPASGQAVDALVLVAPAVLAMQGGLQSLSEFHERLPSAHLGVEPNRVQRFACSVQTRAGSAAEPSHNRQPSKQSALQRAWRAALTLGQGIMLLGLLALLQVLRPVVIALLRALVRSRTFWLRGLQQAYHDPGAVTDEVVDAYRLPQLVRGWESGMFMFLVSRIAHLAEPKAWLARASAAIAVAGDPEGEEEVGLSQRLSTFVGATGLPVLIIHGETDRLVPLSNSMRLAAMLPGSEVAVIRECGHMPQEECPRLFTELVADFVGRRVRPRSND